MKFHDGQEMTSADVKYTFDRLFEVSPGKSDFIAVDKVEPAGKYRIKFVTKEPFAGLLAALAASGAHHQRGGVKKYGDLNKAAMGTGPFMLEDWKVEQQLVLKKNPNYFKRAALRRRAHPARDSRRGQYRGRPPHRPDSPRFPRGQQELQPSEGREDAHRIPSSRLGYDYLNINASRGPLKDVRVRQAISWTVDRSQVMRVAASGFGRLTAPATQPMKQWQIPEEQWMRYYKADVEKAKKLMADAGRPTASRQALRHPDVPDDGIGAPVVAAKLKRIGINARSRTSSTRSGSSAGSPTTST